ncbi:MAG: TetR/AcrR family transcriptional regulator [Bdellovibrionaceae bacterium]|nr:TetR/AcrR family transcriptional regulator [Pseudobdellovibrionaceae bacterium]
MKISKAQKEKNLVAIIEAAIKLSNKDSFKTVSMKAIAQEAGISDATIYNYFPTKEEIITGYFELRMKQAILAAKKSEEYLALDYFQKIQWLIENHLDNLRKDGDFLSQSLNQLFVQPISLAQTSVGKSKQKYLAFLDTELQVAIEKKEFDSPPFASFICELIWDFHLGMVFYWIKDKSNSKANSSQLIQMGVELLKEVMCANILNKAYNIAHFLFKEHLLSKLFQLGLTRE